MMSLNQVMATIMNLNQGTVTIIIAVVTSGLTWLASRSTNATTLVKTNNENAIQLFKQYETMNLQLQQKVDNLEAKLERIQSEYAQQIDIYKTRIEELEDENERLKLVINNLQGGTKV